MTVVVLTGSGISAESGVATFRDPDGVWAKIDYREVATPEGFAANPQRVHAFYNSRRAALPTVAPNPAHLALADLEQAVIDAREDFLLVTQNVDDLHDRAGSERILPMHGRLDRACCTHCGEEMPWREDLSVDVACPACGRLGGMRPAVVWFGEMPRGLTQIEAAMATATDFLAVGTSGTVYPAAGLVALAKDAGARTTLINLEPAENAPAFDDVIDGSAATEVPRWVSAFVAGL